MKLYGMPNETHFVKDAFHDAYHQRKIVKNCARKKQGTKFSPVYNLKLKAGETKPFIALE